MELHDSSKRQTLVANLIYLRRLSDARRSLAWIERPRGSRLPRLDINHLNRVLAFVIHEDMSLAIGSGAFRRIVLQFHVAHDVAGSWIERCESADRSAVVGEDDQVVGLIVHDAVEAALAHGDPLDLGQRLEIEHRDPFVAAVSCKAVARLGGNTGAVNTGCVRNIAQHFPGGAFDHHHMGAARHKNSSGGGFHGDVVRASIALNIKFLHLERLRTAHAGSGEDACKEHRCCGEESSSHAVSFVVHDYARKDLRTQLYSLPIQAARQSRDGHSACFLDSFTFSRQSALVNATLLNQLAFDQHRRQVTTDGDIDTKRETRIGVDNSPSVQQSGTLAPNGLVGDYSSGVGYRPLTAISAPPA